MDMEAAMKRIPPHSAEAEQAVLGAMLMNKEAISMASEIITGEDFYQTAYGILFDCIVEMFQQGKPVDLITLQDYLKEKMFRRRSAIWNLREIFSCRHRHPPMQIPMQRSSGKNP